MSTLDKFHTLLRQGETTTDTALELFDELPTVDVAFMMGKWKGSGFKTHHRMDGLLETIGWYGKEFINPDCVHPLLFGSGDKIFKVDPNPIAFNLGMSIDLPKKNRSDHCI